MEKTATVRCQNKLCGKTVSTQFEKCPFCGTPISRLSVDEILEDLSEKEKDEQQTHREKVLRYYNIDGDVSDEQFEVLDKKYHQAIHEKSIPLLSPKAESILHKYGEALYIIGIILMALLFIAALVFIILMAINHEPAYLLTAIYSIIAGVLVLLSCIVTKAFIDVYVNISVTVQNIDAKIKDNR